MPTKQEPNQISRNLEIIAKATYKQIERKAAIDKLQSQVNLLSAKMIATEQQLMLKILFS